MAKFKPAGTRKSKRSDVKGAAPCLIIIVAGITLICLLFYFALKSST